MFTFSLEKLVSLVLIIGSFGMGAGVLVHKIDQMATKMDSIEQSVQIIRARQYVMLGVAVDQGWPIPQAILGRAIVEGWTP